LKPTLCANKSLLLVIEKTPCWSTQSAAAKGQFAACAEAAGEKLPQKSLFAHVGKAELGKRQGRFQ
jgi:hypothetical protein